MNGTVGKKSTFANRTIIIELVVEVTDYDAVPSDMRSISIALSIIIAIGVVGNIINMIVFSRKSMRTVSTFRFLLYLSAFDLLVLLVCSTEAYAQFRYHYEIRSVSTLICRVHTFLTYFLSHCSSNILMVISIDRALVITNRRSIFRFRRKNPQSASLKNKPNRYSLVNIEPLKQNWWSCLANFSLNLHRVDMAMILIAFMIIILNIHYFLFLSLNRVEDQSETAQQNSSDYYSFEYANGIEVEVGKETRQVCFPMGKSLYNKFLVRIWTWIDLVIFSLVPFVTMSVCSLIILVKIRDNSKKYFKILINRNIKNSKSSAFQKRVRRNRQVLCMLLLTNFYFLLSSLPYFVSSLLFQGERNDTPIAQSLVHLLLYTNNAINFLFYGFSSEKYREEFIKIFSRKKLNSASSMDNRPLPC
jgi:hypothetical protein